VQALNNYGFTEVSFKVRGSVDSELKKEAGKIKKPLPQWAMTIPTWWPKWGGNEKWTGWSLRQVKLEIDRVARKYQDFRSGKFCKAVVVIEAFSLCLC